MSGSEREHPEADLAEVLAHASNLAEDERWPEAYALLLEEEPTSPRDAALLCMLGVAAREVGAEGAAYDFFRRCLAEAPENPVLLAVAGRGVAASDDPDAERVLRLAALTAPHQVVTRLSYGAYLAREGLFDTAMPELQAARDLAPDDPEVRAELGFAFFLAGRIDEGLAELAEAHALAADDSAGQALYGLALVEGGRIEEAAEQLVSASRELTEDWELQLAAALAAAAQEWADEAWAALARADLVEGADRSLLLETEDVIEAGPDEARDFLAQEFAAPLLRARLRERA